MGDQGAENPENTQHPNRSVPEVIGDGGRRLQISTFVSVLLVAAVFLISACGDDEISTSPSVDDGVLIPSNISTDPAEVLPAISKSMDSARTWQVQARLTVTDETEVVGQSLISTIDAARSAPDSNIILTSNEVITGSITGSTSSENRVVSGVKYRRDPNSGEWTTSDAKSASPSLTVDAAVVDQLEVSSAELRVEDFDGEKVFHITGTIPGVAAAAGVDIYAGYDDFLVRMIRLEGTAHPENFGGLLTLNDRPLPQIVEARFFNHGRRIAVHIPPSSHESTGTGVQTYLSTINPFKMVLPSALKASPRTELGMEAFKTSGGEALFIVEEDLDVDSAYVGELEGVSPDTNSYARRFEIDLGVSGQYTVLSNEPYTTDSGLEARLIQFTEAEGDIRWMHLSYLHEEDFGFGASYGSSSDRFGDIEGEILSSFKSFDIIN